MGWQAAWTGAVMYCLTSPAHCGSPFRSTTGSATFAPWARRQAAKAGHAAAGSGPAEGRARRDAHRTDRQQPRMVPLRSPPATRSSARSFAVGAHAAAGRREAQGKDQVRTVRDRTMACGSPHTRRPRPMRRIGGRRCGSWLPSPVRTCEQRSDRLHRRLTGISATIACHHEHLQQQTSRPPERAAAARPRRRRRTRTSRTCSRPPCATKGSSRRSAIEAGASSTLRPRCVRT